MRRQTGVESRPEGLSSRFVRPPVPTQAGYCMHRTAGDLRVVLSIMPYSDYGQAAALANDTLRPHGLDSGVKTPPGHDGGRAHCGGPRVRILHLRACGNPCACVSPRRLTGPPRACWGRPRTFEVVRLVVIDP
jgi:hypothetical protein